MTRERECKMHSEFWWGNLKERDDLVGLGYELIFYKAIWGGGEKSWPELMCLGIGTSDVVLKGLNRPSLFIK